MKSKLLLFLVTFILLFHSVENFAQSSTARFLYWQPSAEITAMGGAGVAIPDNAFAAYYNPASFGFAKSFRIAASYVKPNPTFDGDIHSMISFSCPIQSFGTVAVSLNSFWLGMNYRTGEASPEPIGTFGDPGILSPTHIQLKLSYASLINENISIGFSVSYLRMDLDKDLSLPNGTRSFSTILLDGGIIFKNLFSDVSSNSTNEISNKIIDDTNNKGLSAGLSLLSFGPTISFIDAEQSDPPPSMIVLGFNYYHELTNSIGASMLLDFEKRIFDSKTLDYIHIGDDILFFRIFSIRTGYVIDTQNSNTSYFTFGFGAKIKFAAMNISHYKKFLTPAWHIDAKFNVEL
jgi:hypothetical protein